MPIDETLLHQLDERRANALVSGVPAKVEERHDKGLLTARERVDALFQTGSFQEFGMFAEHQCTNFGMADKKLPGDGVVTGVGLMRPPRRRFQPGLPRRRRLPRPRPRQEDL